MTWIVTAAVVGAGGTYLAGKGKRARRGEIDVLDPRAREARGRLAARAKQLQEAPETSREATAFGRAQNIIAQRAARRSALIPRQVAEQVSARFPQAASGLEAELTRRGLEESQQQELAGKAQYDIELANLIRELGREGVGIDQYLASLGSGMQRFEQGRSPSAQQRFGNALLGGAKLATAVYGAQQLGNDGDGGAKDPYQDPTNYTTSGYGGGEYGNRTGFTEDLHGNSPGFGSAAGGQR